MLRTSTTALTRRLLASVAPSYPSGIEHADALKAMGQKNSMKPTDYKVPLYHNTNSSSYYDVELKMQKKRSAQPNPKQPDTERKATNAPSAK